MPYDDDTARGHEVQRISIPEPPLNAVPVAPDVADAIREFSETYLNLGPYAVFGEIRRGMPSVTLDEVRTVMAGEASA